MVKVPIDIVGPAYKMRAVQLDTQTCINWYLTFDPTGKFPKALLPRPGLRLFIDDDNESSVRGLYTLKNVLYAVVDNSFYVCYPNGSRDKKGTLNTSVGLVKILANDYQLFITDGKNGYIYQVIGTDIYAQGIFFVVQNASSQIGVPIFYGSGINDLTTSGTYIGEEELTYKIQIDGDSSPNTFRWSDDDGSTWIQQNVTITGFPQLLNNGLYISFLNIDGHTLNDYWEIETTIESSFYDPIYPTYQDGFGIYPRQNTNRFYLSQEDDFSRVNATDYASSNVYADNLIAVISVHDEIYLIGEVTTEIWYNTGNADFPFGRRRNVILNYGCEAPFTVKVGADNLIFMLASNNDGGRVVVKIVNYNISIISTEPLNEELRSYATISDAFSFLIERNGHIFYIITFPTENKTWVYDLLTNSWSEWKSIEPQQFPSPFSKSLGRFRGNCHTVFNGNDIIGDSITGKIFIMDEESNEDYDEPIICERTTSHSSTNNELMSLNSLEIDVEKGVGLVTGQGDDPTIMISISRDGGKSWGGELFSSLGKIGEFKKRILFYGLGTSRIFTFKLRISDPVYKVILGAIADIDLED